MKDIITSNSCWIKDDCKKYRFSDCECKHDDIFCIKLYKLNFLFDQALITDKLRKRIPLYTDADGADREIFEALHHIEKDVVNFVNSGSNLYLRSATTGNGKTSWALRIVQDYFNEIWADTGLTCRALFIHVPRLFQNLKESISNGDTEYAKHIKKYIFEADLVVWDEIAVKHLTPYEQEQLLYYLSTRLDSGKSNIYTSNLSPEEFVETVGNRLYSRVCGSCGSQNIHVFSGADKRGITLP